MNIDSATTATGQAEDEARKRRFVRLACVVVGGASLAYLLASPWLAHRSLASLTAPAIFLLTGLLALGLLRRQGAHAAGLALVYSLCAGALLAGALIGNVSSTSIYSLIVVIAMADWLAGPRHAVAVTLLSLGGTLGISLALDAGLLQAATPSRSVTAWVGLALLLMVSAFFSRIVALAFQAQLARSEQLRHALRLQVDRIHSDEAQLRLIAENMPAMVAHIGRDRRCRYANPQYAAFFGHDEKRVIGMHSRDMVGEAAYAEIVPWMERAYAGERVAYRRELRGRDGAAARVIEASLVPERGSDGEIAGLFVLIQDITDMLRREKERQQSEEKFAKVFRASPLAIAIARLADGRFLDVNDEWTRLHGWSRAEAVGRTADDMALWSSPAEREAWVAGMQKDGRVGNFAARLGVKDGPPRDVLLSSERVDLGGEDCALVMEADLTERLRAEQALQESEAMLDVAVQSGNIGLWAWDILTGRLTWNDHLLAIFGLPAETRDLTLPRFLAAIHPGDLDETQRAWKAALDTRAIFDHEYRIVRPDGTVRWIVARGVGEYAEDGAPRRMTGAALDTTDYKTAEAALQESEAMLKEAQRIGHVGSWELDIHSQRMTWSGELYRIYEQDPAGFDTTWANLLSVVHPDDLPIMQNAWRTSPTADGSYETRHRILTPDGRVKHLSVRFEIFPDDRGRPSRALGTVQDVTEQALARAEVERLNAELETRVQERTAELTAANRELESFAYSISHDLRAPLRGIDGFSHLLAEEYAPQLDDTGRGYLDRVRRAAQRMGALIDDILELSRVTRQEMRRVRVDLSQIAVEVLDERARAEPAHRVEAVIAPDCQAFGDPQLLRVLMQNLLENAWKYSARQAAPSIAFGQEQIDDEPVFFVRDNGVGFDMKYAGRLFTPFQRLHKPEEYEGTGIGLATVARVAHRHGGRAWIEAAPGKGAAVRFTLGSPGAIRQPDPACRP